MFKEKAENFFNPTILGEVSQMGKMKNACRWIYKLESPTNWLMDEKYISYLRWSSNT